MAESYSRRLWNLQVTARKMRVKSSDRYEILQQSILVLRFADGNSFHRKMIAGIKGLHDKGVVHRDLKVLQLA